MLAWVDPGHTHGTTVSKGKGTMVEEGIFGLCQWCEYLGKE